MVIGKDTRLSGYMIEQALTAGLLASGMDVFLLGPVPTPAVAMLTRSMRADLGVMISASHNPFHDNGIKIFGPDGYKLSDDQELKIEDLIDNPAQGDAGRLHRKLAGPSALKTPAPATSNLPSAPIPAKATSMACASSSIRPMARPTRRRPRPCGNWVPRSSKSDDDPNGTNINDKCGSTHPEVMCEKVRELRADIGIALDGDADRVIICR